MINRPFAYNPSRTPISGTTQIGDIAIGVDALDYSTNPGGVQWWNGPDEELGYVIAQTFSGGTYHTPNGNIGTMHFKRSTDLTTDSYLDLVNNLSNGAVTGLTDIQTWLDTNGYCSQLQNETIIQKNRIEADGGVVIDLNFMNLVIMILKNMGIYGNAKLLLDANFGVKKDGTGAVSKLYDISGNNNDAIQTTGAYQPIWSMSGSTAVITYDGVNDILIIPNTAKWYPVGSILMSVKLLSVVIKNFYAMSDSTKTSPEFRMFSPGLLVYYWNGKYQPTPHTFSLNTSNFTLIHSQLNINKLSNWRNGVSIDTDAVVDNCPNNNLFYHSIGGRTYSPEYANVIIPFLIEFNSILTDIQRNSINNIFNSYYNIY